MIWRLCSAAVAQTSNNNYLQMYDIHTSTVGEYRTVSVTVTVITGLGL